MFLAEVTMCLGDVRFVLAGAERGVFLRGDDAVPGAAGAVRPWNGVFFGP